MRRQIDSPAKKSWKCQPGSRRIIPSPTEVAIQPQTTTVSVVERAVPNGDLYLGDFSHGSWKYHWTDGYMYEGDWHRGKASGATFQGSFKSGIMDGYGTFTGCSYGRDSYQRGTWSAYRKQGYGSKSYANGDHYEGTWKKNVQDGHGWYIWRNGNNQYIGEWKNGVMSGRGVLIWANGNRYDGNWECGGIPKENGVFSWPDGNCCYIGNLVGRRRRKQMEEEEEEEEEERLCGTFFYPSTGGGRSSLEGKNFPRICIWESDGEAGDITCDIVDTFEVYNEEEDVVVVNKDSPSPSPSLSPSPCCFQTGGEVKRPGEMISKGHKNYELMLNLQLGIRYSVGKQAASTKMLSELRNGDFDPKDKFWTKFPPGGSKITPPHQSAEFRWKDYCPIVFRHLRKLFAVDPADYMMAVCGNDALRELSSPGKSGSFFYLTQDDRFMIKTAKKSEIKVLIRMLPSYYQHVCRYENSLVTKFFGVHCVKPIGGQKVRFIVMGNLFCSEHRIHKRFDLKGSSHGRTTDKGEDEIDETTTLKDLDLNFVFRLQKSWLLDLLWQIDRDCEFLEGEGIMDYSLLVGLHFCDDISASKMGFSFPRLSSNRDSFQSGGVVSDFPSSESAWKNTDRIADAGKPVIRLGANMPARAEHIARNSNFEAYPTMGGAGELLIPPQHGEMYDVVLYFGIIDILQDYDISKKLEHAYKSLQVDPTSISAVDPKLYSRRFRDFILRVFVEDND